MELAGLEDYIREEDNQRFRSSTFMDEQSDSDSEGSYDDDDAFVNSAFLGGERLLDPKGRRIELQDSHTWANKPVEHRFDKIREREKKRKKKRFFPVCSPALMRAVPLVCVGLLL